MCAVKRCKPRSRTSASPTESFAGAYHHETPRLLVQSLGPVAATRTPSQPLTDVLDALYNEAETAAADVRATLTDARTEVCRSRADAGSHSEEFI
jgi:hypothetical protein